MTKKETQKIIIGFVGEMACGKGTAAHYLNKEYRADGFRFSTILRDTLDRVYLPHTRDNMVALSVLLRERFGDDVLANAMAEDVKRARTRLVTVDGIRRPADIVHLRSFKGFYLVALEARAKTRWQRMRARGENQDDTTKTWEQFQKDGKKSTETKIRSVMKTADFVVDNNGALKDFHRQLDAIVKSVTAKK